MKRFKTKKRSKKKIIFSIIIIIFSFYITITLLTKFNNISNKDILNNLISDITNNYNIIDRFKEKIANPSNIIYNSFNKNVGYEDIKVFSEVGDVYFDYDNALSEFVYEVEPKKVDKPIVYIYNTHQLEEYAKNKNSEHSVSPNVLIASFMLKEKLNNKGINTIVENANIKAYLNKHNMNYYESYDASRYYIINALKKNSSIKYIIDLHRDSIKKEYSTVTYKKKKYAKVMFVIGLGNRGYKSNLKLANTLNKEFESRVPGITRNITKYPGDETNAVYNQDLSKNAFLIELGGYENTMEEINNTLDVLTDILYSLIKE